jgi:hypothetical protein
MLLLICTDESLMSMMCANENRERYSFPIIFGGRNRDRTCDIQLVRLALSQLSYSPLYLAGSTGLEPAASGVTGRRYNRLNYDPAKKFPSKQLEPSSTLWMRTLKLFTYRGNPCFFTEPHRVGYIYQKGSPGVKSILS